MAFFIFYILKPFSVQSRLKRATIAFLNNLRQNVEVFELKERMAPDEEQGAPNMNSDQLADLLCVDRSCIFVVLDRRSAEDNEAFVSKIRILLSEFGILTEKDFGFFSGETDLRMPSKCYVFVLQYKAVERCRDRLKEFFFRIYLHAGEQEKIFDLSEYLTFVCPPKKKEGEILQHTFVHGVGRFYRFTFNPKRLSTKVGSLNNFLAGLPQNCPNHLFLCGPKASKGDWDFPITTQQIEHSDLPELAKKSSLERLMKRPHENLEKYLILHDPKTFACEVPIWLQPSDFSDYSARFKTESCITGHIDILRLEENGQIGLWDYKPNAAKETKAAPQVWFYMMMLSKRTGIPIAQISGGYFDECATYRVFSA